jgi:hypothetical protein
MSKEFEGEGGQADRIDGVWQLAHVHPGVWTVAAKVGGGNYAGAWAPWRGRQAGLLTKECHAAGSRDSMLAEWSDVA